MTNPTSNYGFVLPTATDLVTDLPADFEVALQGVDTQLKALNPATTLGDLSYASSTANTNTRLPIGTTGQVLTVTGGVPTWATANPGDITGVTAGTGISGGGTSGDVTVTNSMATAIDAKGDLVPGTGADTFARLAVGANDTVLTADSTTATGLKWASVPAASGPAFFGYRGTSNQSIAQNTITKVTYNAEVYDTDNCFNTTTGRFTPTKAGKYQINVNVYVSMNAAGRALFKLYKNGSAFINLGDFGSSTSDFITSGSCLIDMNGSTDYLEVYALGSSTSNSLPASSGASSEQYNVFSGTWVRS